MIGVQSEVLLFCLVSSVCLLSILGTVSGWVCAISFFQVISAAAGLAALGDVTVWLTQGNFASNALSKSSAQNIALGAPQLCYVFASRYEKPLQNE